MPIVTISVDCESANSGKCYARELVHVAESCNIPLTWLVYVSEKDPMSNVNLYHTEYYHRIPSWHEMGLLLDFHNSTGYISDPQDRASAIRLGKDVLKQCHIKPTSFRAQSFDLLPDDIKILEDIGILVDSSVCPGAQDKHAVAWPEWQTQPYHPDYANLSKPGDAKLLMAPLSTYKGMAGYLDRGWDKLKPVLENCLNNCEVVNLALSDNVDNAETLKQTIELCKSKNAQFVTLTYLAAR